MVGSNGIIYISAITGQIFPKAYVTKLYYNVSNEKTPNIKSYISQQPLVGSSQRVKNLTYKTEGLRVKDGG